MLGPRMLNIRGANTRIDEDPFYRYQMPAVIVVSQGGHSVIKNFSVICKAIGRPPKKFLRL
jgi:translation initiation factor 2 beta subunit (eIF-2beta)/eIF-5